MLTTGNERRQVGGVVVLPLKSFANLIEHVTQDANFLAKGFDGRGEF